MSGAREICYRCQNFAGGCNGSCRPSAPSYWSITNPQPKGCICPPTSEKTCQRFDCGRRTSPLAQADQGSGSQLADATPKSNPRGQ